MKQYSYKFKVKLVKEYQRGEGSAKDLAKKYSICGHGLIERWIGQVQNRGFKALHPGEWIRYPVDYKLEVVNYCLKNGISQNATALHFGIDNPTISRWIKTYQRQGVAGFCPKHQRRQKAMKKPARSITADASQRQEIQKLQDELYEVKMERDTLKKLIAVTQMKLPTQKKHQ